jgi:phage-related protein
MEAAEGSWTNAMADIGAVIAPELKELIKSLGEIANGVGAWVRANPELAKQIIKTVAGLALLMVGMGALSIGLASLIGPFAVVRYGMMLFGIKSLGLMTALKSLGGALTWVGRAVLWIGRALMLNPIGLAVTAIALAAYLIYKNWEPIKAFFMGLWAEVKAGFDGGFAGIRDLIINFSPLGLFYRAFAGVMGYFGIELPSKFTEFGSMLMQGLVTGITNGLAGVKDSITGAADSTIGWFKEKLGIHSPSRVFASLGGFTMAGLGQGLAGGEQDVLKQVANTAQRMTEVGAGTVGIGSLSVDRRAPISAGAGGMLVQGDTIEITIQATPGTDTAGLRQMLNQLLDERERNKAARLRSRLSDQE